MVSISSTTSSFFNQEQRSSLNQSQARQNASEDHQDNTTRIQNTTVCVPFVYGSIAFPLKKAEEYNTHKWTLFLRGPNNEDLSQGIAKVVFQLHPSFAQSVRELTAPPFEVTEKGWGEFEATIRVVWRDPKEKALVLVHMIKLYPPVEEGKPAAVLGTTVPSSGKGNNDHNAANNKKEIEPVIHQYYDEVVFTDPEETFYHQLLHTSTSKKIHKVESLEPSVQKYFKPFSDHEDFKKLLEAQKFLEKELISVKERILRADAAKLELENAMMEVSTKNKFVTAAAAAVTSNTNPFPTPGSKRKSKSSGGGTKKVSKVDNNSTKTTKAKADGLN